MAAAVETKDDQKVTEKKVVALVESVALGR